MYEKTPNPPAQADHIVISNQFANEIMDRFNPTQVNEMLKNLRGIIANKRQEEIGIAEKQIAYLNESLSNL